MSSLRVNSKILPQIEPVVRPASSSANEKPYQSLINNAAQSQIVKKLPIYLGLTALVVGLLGVIGVGYGYKSENKKITFGGLAIVGIGVVLGVLSQMSRKIFAFIKDPMFQEIASKFYKQLPSVETMKALDECFTKDEISNANASLKTLEDFNSLKDKSPAIRCYAALALGSLGGMSGVIGEKKEEKEGLDLLIDFVKDEHHLVRAISAWALGQSGNKKALDVLKKAQLDDTNHLVRNEARNAIEKLTSKKVVSSTNGKFKITRSTIDEIRKTIGSRAPEQGGMLGSKNGSGTVTDFYFDRTGSSTPVAFTVGHKELTQVLKTQWKPAGIELIGMIHSHPSGVRHLTGADIEYAEKFLNKDPQLDQLLTPIVVNTGKDGEDMEILPFAVVRDGNGSTVKELELEVID